MIVVLKQTGRWNVVWKVMNISYFGIIISSLVSRMLNTATLVLCDFSVFIFLFRHERVYQSTYILILSYLGFYRRQDYHQTFVSYPEMIQISVVTNILCVSWYVCHWEDKHNKWVKNDIVCVLLFILLLYFMLSLLLWVCVI